MPVFPSYINQSIDLHSKSIAWFLCEGNTGTYWVKYLSVGSVYSEFGNNAKVDI